ncbi:MAG TPA: hypothetical protein VET48_02525 [Steroidobacteraceae bacterium]|nr:hypothetical protein [Steroidobacteraceae bacterium]
MSYSNGLACLIVASLVSGCVALNERDEFTWQTMHAIDTVQTFHIARDPRYKEVESAWLIGEYPDEKAVLAWSIGWSLAHASVTQLLIDHDYPKLTKAWQYVTLTSVCNTVGNNAFVGIQIGGPNANPGPAWRAISDWSNRKFGPQGQ